MAIKAVFLSSAVVVSEASELEYKKKTTTHVKGISLSLQIIRKKNSEALNQRRS